MGRRQIPETVDGLKVKKVVDTWNVDDTHGSRTYCRLRLEDKREVTLLRLDGAWVTVFVDSFDGARW